jgi:mono/diheme cytochrome c family protein
MPITSVLRLSLMYAVMLLGTVIAQAPVAVTAPTFGDVAVILDERCILCHQGAAAPLGLRLDSFAGIMAGSQRGPVVTPGQPDESELVRRLEGTSLPRMPLTGPPFLDEDQLALVRRWIEAGALDGDSTSQAVAPAQEAQPAQGAPQGQPAPQDPVQQPAQEPAPAPGVAFASVESIFLTRCALCHTAQGAMGAPPEGLRLDSYENILAGTDRAVVVPGAPLASEVYRRVLGYSLPRMPFGGPYLDAEEVERIGSWIAGGARDAAGVAAPLPVGREVRLGGTLTGIWELDGLPLQVTPETRIDDSPSIGDVVEVRGVVTAEGGVRVERVRGR